MLLSEVEGILEVVVGVRFLQLVKVNQVRSGDLHTQTHVLYSILYLLMVSTIRPDL